VDDSAELQDLKAQLKDLQKNLTASADRLSHGQLRNLASSIRETRERLSAIADVSAEELRPELQSLETAFDLYMGALKDHTYRSVEFQTKYSDFYTRIAELRATAHLAMAALFEKFMVFSGAALTVSVSVFAAYGSKGMNRNGIVGRQNFILCIAFFISSISLCLTGQLGESTMATHERQDAADRVWKELLLESADLYLSDEEKRSLDQDRLRREYADAAVRRHRSSLGVFGQLISGRLGGLLIASVIFMMTLGLLELLLFVLKNT
jgi:hypothetical protein